MKIKMNNLEMNVSKQDVTKQIINEKVQEGDPFSWLEVDEDVTNQGGCDITMNHYLIQIEKEGYIKYDLHENKYIVKNKNLGISIKGDGDITEN